MRTRLITADALAPAIQAPAIQALVIQAPVTQAPVTQAPVTQAPVVQAIGKLIKRKILMHKSFTFVKNQLFHLFISGFFTWHIKQHH